MRVRQGGVRRGGRLCMYRGGFEESKESKRKRKGVVARAGAGMWVSAGMDCLRLEEESVMHIAAGMAAMVAVIMVIAPDSDSDLAHSRYREEAAWMANETRPQTVYAYSAFSTCVRVFLGLRLRHWRSRSRWRLRLCLRLSRG